MNNKPITKIISHNYDVPHDVSHSNSPNLYKSLNNNNIHIQKIPIDWGLMYFVPSITNQTNQNIDIQTIVR